MTCFNLILIWCLHLVLSFLLLSLKMRNKCKHHINNQETFIGLLHEVCTEYKIKLNEICVLYCTFLFVLISFFRYYMVCSLMYICMARTQNHTTNWNNLVWIVCAEAYKQTKIVCPYLIFLKFMSLWCHVLPWYITLYIILCNMSKAQTNWHKLISMAEISTYAWQIFYFISVYTGYCNFTEIY